MKTTVPIIIAFLSGFVMILAFFVSPESVTFGDFELEPEVLSWVTIVGGFTLLLGVVSIVRVNYNAVKRRNDGWIYKLATLISVFAMAIPAVIPNRLSPLFGTGPGSIYDWLFGRVMPNRHCCWLQRFLLCCGGYQWVKLC